MVRERHEVKLPGTPEFKKYLKSERFIREVQVPLKDHHEVLMRVMDDVKDDDSTHQTVELTWTKDNEGGLKDALDFLVNKLIVNGLDAGSIKDDTRLQSDTFEQILPFFNPAVLQARPPTAGSGSPIKPNFMSLPKPESKGSIFDRLRRPGMASITSFLERRKRNAGSPAELFRHASANASRASLVSVESQESGFRNPWNDSGINLPDDDSTKHLRTGSSYSVNSLTSLKLTDSNGRSEVRSIGSPVGHHGSGFRSGPASRKSTMNSVSSATRPAMSRPPSATPGSQPSVPQQMPHILQQHVKHQQLQLPANLQVPPKPQQPRGVTPLTPQK